MTYSFFWWPSPVGFVGQSGMQHVGRCVCRSSLIGKWGLILNECRWVMKKKKGYLHWWSDDWSISKHPNLLHDGISNRRRTLQFLVCDVSQHWEETWLSAAKIFDVGHEKLALFQSNNELNTSMSQHRKLDAVAFGKLFHHFFGMSNVERLLSHPATSLHWARQWYQS